MRLYSLLLITLVSIAESAFCLAQDNLRSLENLYNYKPKNITDFDGTCKMDIGKNFNKCNDSVSWVISKNGVASLTFSKGKDMFVLTGRGDRQPTPEHYYQFIDRLQLWENGIPTTKYEKLKGECHFKLNKDATKFFRIKCDVYNANIGIMYKFYLEDISSFQRK